MPSGEEQQRQGQIWNSVFRALDQCRFLHISLCLYYCLKSRIFFLERCPPNSYNKVLIVKGLYEKFIYMEPFSQLLYQDRKNFHAFLIDTTRWLLLKAKCQCAILTRRTLAAPPLYQPPFTACLSDHAA